jgi:polar amino acid transport system permease protein
MKRRAALMRIVTPQSLRVIIPPTGNQIIGLLKATSLVSVVGGGELLTRTQYIYGSNFAVMPLLTVATFWYLVLVSIGSIIQNRIERRLDHDRGRQASWSSFARRLNPVSAPLFRVRSSEPKEIPT